MDGKGVRRLMKHQKLAEEIVRWAYGREGLNRTPRLFSFRPYPVLVTLRKDATLVLRCSSPDREKAMQSADVAIIGRPTDEVVADVADKLDWIESDGDFLRFEEEEEG